MEIKPKPCPFCGCQITFTENCVTQEYGACYCSSCGAMGPLVKAGYDESDENDDAEWRKRAVIEWNRRA